MNQPNSSTSVPRGPRQPWLYRVATRLTRDAWQDDQRATWQRAIRAYHDELTARSQRTKHADACAGWWTGLAPYGYRRITQRTHDTGGRRRTRHLLSLEPHRAPVVPTIYGWYLTDQLSVELIAQRLAADPGHYPLPLDHNGRSRAWTTSIVRGVLDNPAYTGYTVRGRTRHGVRQPVDRWVWSVGPSHPALINATQFRAVRNRRSGARHRPGIRRRA